eukprot:TRINITY_DN9874_c0_g1_i1.p1 TRINITY_DN9874_c0_g1~~TRINITY_DN9874_c0_g1_i1.p1  ORF type:complete len:534 (+),score=119.84 TRINITY_DN9874_c0_g1_i1:67-1668(+)
MRQWRLLNSLSRHCRCFSGGNAWDDADTGTQWPELQERHSRAGSWGVSQLSNLDDADVYNAAIRKVDLQSGPQALQQLLHAKGCPSPLQVFQDLLRRLQPGAQLRDGCLAVLISHCSKLAKAARHSEGLAATAVHFRGARRIFMQAIREKHQVGELTNSAYVSAAAQCGQPNEAYITFRKMRTLGFPPSAQLYCSVVHAYARAVTPDPTGHEFLEKAWDVFTELARERPFGNASVDEVKETFSVAAVGLLHASARAKKPAETAQVWSLVVDKWGITPNGPMWAARIKVYASCGDAAQALSVFSDMQAAGVPISSRTCTTVLGCLGRTAGDTVEAERVFKQLRQQWEQTGSSDSKPGVEVFTALMQVYRRSGDLAGVRQVYRRMRRAGVHPSSLTINVLLTLCKQNAARPGDDWCRLAVALWRRAVHGPPELRVPAVDAAAPPPRMHQRVVSRVALSALGALTAGGDKGGVQELGDWLERTGEAKRLSVQAPLLRAYQRVGIQGAAQRVKESGGGPAGGGRPAAARSQVTMVPL